ncbi:FecR family protein [Rugamonas sp.]|uniref:FecR family protein n=1 Tax=Rugamonas sp. TaxID=1926287 RepID=UPI0026006C9F|nr:FecR family protein [Rugamonas sp.]
MSPLRKCTVIKALLLLALLCGGSLAWAAQVAGTVIQLSGPMLAKKADGGLKILSLKSEVESGDTLVTEKNTYAMIKFIDNSEITLKPATTFKVENFAFDAGKPDGDSASFSLVKGGLRSITGLLGKRNKERFALKTPTATIGIRGTTFIVDYVEASEEAVAAARHAYWMASTAALGDAGVAGVVPLQLAQLTPPTAPGGLPPGLYVQVIDGLINVSNSGGSTNFAAGQFGYTPSIKQPPVILPTNPGLKFTPPPTFSAPAGGSAASSSSKSGSVDCVVR